MVDGMRERTTLEIASRLESLMPIAGMSAVKALRQQHAEIERLREMLAGDHEEPWAENRRLRRYVGNNMLMSDFRNVDEMRAEIKRLTACLFTMQNAAMALTAERDTSIAAAVAAEREARAAEIDRLKRERHHIYDLLARIHRDGGQYAAEHGVEKACDDAESQVAAWLDTINSVDALIEQARIAEREACAQIVLNQDVINSKWSGVCSQDGDASATLQAAGEAIRARLAT